jgi:predicted nucleotidyltransferase
VPVFGAIRDRDPVLLHYVPVLGTIVLDMGTTLGALFPSTRRVLLVELFQRPEQRFYLRELIRLVGKGQGSVQRELKNLVEAGILIRDFSQGRAYYQANAESPVYPELKALIGKTEGVVAKLREQLELLPSIRIAFVFGSVSRDEARPDSDLDLVVIGSVSFRSVIRAVGKAQMELRREINPVVYSEAELRRRVSRGDHFITDVMRGAKLFVIGTPDDLEAMVVQQVAY